MMIGGLVVASSSIISSNHDTRYTIIQIAHEDQYIIVKVLNARRKLKVGAYIIIEAYKIDLSFVTCQENCIQEIGDGHDFDCALEGLPWKKLAVGISMNYCGEITRIIDAEVGLYELDKSFLLLCAMKLSDNMEMTFYNLRRADTELNNDNYKVRLVGCPLFSSCDHDPSGLMEWKYSWSVCDRFIWLTIRADLRNRLKGLVSSVYFKDTDKYEEFGFKVYRALMRKPHSVEPIVEFLSHCERGHCRFCAEPLLPNRFIELNQPETGPILGIMDVCKFTGRPVIRWSRAETFIIGLEPEPDFDQLIIVPVAHYFNDDCLSFIICEQIFYVSPIERSMISVLDHSYELLMIRQICPPMLLNKNEPMVMRLEGYKFGQISFVGENTWKLEMVNQLSIDLSLPAYVVIRKGITIGELLCVSKRSSEDYKKLIVICDPDMQSKEILIRHFDPHSIHICCSKAAFDYLTESQTLLRTRYHKRLSIDLVESIGSKLSLLSSIEAVVISKEFRSANSLGLPQPCRCKLPFHLQGDKYLAVELQIAFRRCRLALPPGILYPLGLIANAKMTISCLKVFRGGNDLLLLPTSRTTFHFIGFSQPEDFTEFPMRFIRELRPYEYATINGRFLKLLFFDAYYVCCSTIKDNQCLAHGKIEPHQVTLKLNSGFLFTDGIVDCEIAILDVNVIQSLMAIDLSQIKALAMTSAIHYNCKTTDSTSFSRLDYLLEPLQTIPFLTHNFTISVVALPEENFETNKAMEVFNVGESSKLQVLSVKRIDYFEQCKKLLTLNTEQTDNQSC